MVKKIAYILLALLIIIQFIRPARNISTAEEGKSPSVRNIPFLPM
jgi:hypothetical protein